MGAKMGGVNGWENVAEMDCIREESVPILNSIQKRTPFS